MNKGCVQVFCGKGDGKSSAAIGKGLFAAIDGKQVIVVQFMKERNENEAKVKNMMKLQISEMV